MKFDLGGYRNISVHPVTGVIGAEIGEVDVSGSLGKTVVDELRQALSQFQVLFFRDQRLDAPGLARFAAYFGELGISPLAPGGLDEHPMVVRMARVADVPSHVRNYGDRWHSDRSSDELPPKGFLLYCEEAPEYGGDTLFASLCEAYAGLPPDIKQQCDRLTGIHSMSGVIDVDGKGDTKQRTSGEKRSAAGIDPAKLDFIRKEVEHPLVCRHPDNGRPFLYVTGAYLVRIKELSETQSAALIEQLNHHVVKPEFTCRFRWRKGSIAVLDNRCTQHYAVNDYAGFARRMLRVELSGDGRPRRENPADRQ